MLLIFLGILVVSIVSVFFNIRQDISITKELFGMGKEMIAEMKKESIDIYSMIVYIVILAVVLSPFLLFTVPLDIVVFLIHLCAEAEMSLASGAAEFKK